jgi:hypothetical protein
MVEDKTGLSIGQQRMGVPKGTFYFLTVCTVVKYIIYLRKDLVMVLSTILARSADGLPLAASMDDEESMDLQDYKNQAKLLFRKLNQTNENRCSVETGPYVFQYL